MIASRTNNTESLESEAKYMFAEWHKMKRKSLKLNQKELAEHLGISLWQVQIYERGDYFPQDFTYYKELFRTLEIDLKNRKTQKRFKSARKVAQINKFTGEVIKIHESAVHAAHRAKYKSEAIRDVCRGRRKTCGGFKWKYVEED